MPEAEHCSSKIVDFTKKYVVEMVENEQSHSLFPKGGGLSILGNRQFLFHRVQINDLSNNPDGPPPKVKKRSLVMCGREGSGS